MYKVDIIADSVAPNGARLVTFEVTFPRIVLAELNKHRMLSSNVSSSRAVPLKRYIEAVKEDPFIPEKFPVNKSGMQNEEWLEGSKAEEAKEKWLLARDSAVEHAETLLGLSIHKQIANRLLEPFLWTTAIITGTDYANFFALRCHPMAQAEIQKFAYMMRDEYLKSKPRELREQEWHTPYVSDFIIQNFSLEDVLNISAARCARISYLNRDNKTPEEDIKLAERLSESGHFSPFEHVAMAQGKDMDKYIANFRGWLQFRKLFENENIRDIQN